MDPKIALLFMLIGSVIGLSHLSEESLGRVRRQLSARRWRERTSLEPQSATERQAAMHAVNPLFIPRNHRVEAVIQAAVNSDDYAPFEKLVKVLARPYDDQPDYAAYADPPLPDQRVLQTFCGT